MKKSEVRLKLAGAVARAEVLFAERFPNGSRGMEALDNSRAGIARSDVLEGIAPRFIYRNDGPTVDSLFFDDGMGMVVCLREAPSEKIALCLLSLEALYASAEKEQAEVESRLVEIESVLARVAQKAFAPPAAGQKKRRSI